MDSVLVRTYVCCVLKGRLHYWKHVFSRWLSRKEGLKQASKEHVFGEFLEGSPPKNYAHLIVGVDTRRTHANKYQGLREAAFSD